MVTIQTFTHIVAASGVEASTEQGQGGNPTATTHLQQPGGFSTLANLFSFTGASLASSFTSHQGASHGTHVIVRKIQDAQSEGLVFNNIIQNSSFENGGSRWVIGRTAGTSHSINVVTQAPGGVGFDNAPATIVVPNGSKMAHTAKNGQDGAFALFQDMSVASVSSTFLRNFEFSVAPDSAFTKDFSNEPPFTPGRYGLVTLEFKLEGATVHTIAYSFTGNELPPSAPSGFPSITQRIDLTHPGGDVFARFSRDLQDDLSTSFTFDGVRIWLVSDMIDSLLVTSFDILWDWFILEVGVFQPALFPTSTLEQIVSANPELTIRDIIFGVIGTVETVENFYDRSQFFFESFHEADPNTIRDLTEVEPFLLFSTTTISSFEFTRNTPSSTTVIADKASEFSSQSVSPTNLMVNHDFSQGFTGWQLTPDTFFGVEPGEPWVDVIASTDATPDRDIISTGLFPTQGSLLLFADVGTGDRGPGFFQDLNVNGIINSLDLEAFGLDCTVARVISADLSFVLQFFLQGSQVYQFTYRVDNMLDRSNDSNYSSLDFSPVDVGTLSPDVNRSNSPNVGEFTTLKGQLSIDMQQASFDFDQVKIFSLFGAESLTNELVFDNFFLTVNTPPAHLKVTSGPAHVNTTDPLSSESADHLTVTGTAGINVFDAAGPFFDETVPLSGTGSVIETTSVAFHVKDLSTDLDAGNVDVWISGEQVVTASVPIVTSTWSSNTKQIITNKDIAYEFFRSSPFGQGVTVTVSGELADLADPVSNQTITDYEFTVVGSGILGATISGSEDGDPPILTPTEPVDLATQVSSDSNVLWTTTDNAAGVDPATVKLFLNGALKVDGITAGATGGLVSFTTNASRGFDVVYNPNSPFTFGETVTGTLEAFDLADTPNFASVDFEFTVTPDNTLSIVDFFMIPGETTLLTSGTELTVTALDLTHGVASGTTFLTINGAVPSGIVTTFSGAGPDRMIFTVPLEPLIDFREDLNILVHAENKFPGNFPVIAEETFVLRPGYDVVWQNKTEDVTGGPEVTFPFVTNVQVVLEAKNFAKNFGTGSEFFRYLTESQSIANLGARLESNINTADLTAVLTSNNPFFEYGKVITVEIEADDFEGNPFRFTHTFKIEPKP